MNLDELKLKLTTEQENKFEKFNALFLEYNSHTNLISKNDAKFLFEKHIFDSLSLNLFFVRYKKPKTILDIGTGGGFPAIPLAIAFPEIEIFAVDSIQKKIKFIQGVKEELGLNNLFPYCQRVEGLKFKPTDLVVSRAVGKFEDVYRLACPNLKDNGFFVAYKTENVDNEIKDKIEKISYTLPTKEKHGRILAIRKKHNGLC